MSETREQELARLIREQRKDDTMIQDPEHGCVSGYGVLLDIVEDGAINPDRITSHRTECPAHGSGELVFDAHQGSGLRCKACSRERARLHRSTSSDRRKREANYRTRRSQAV